MKKNVECVGTVGAHAYIKTLADKRGLPVQAFSMKARVYETTSRSHLSTDKWLHCVAFHPCSLVKVEQGDLVRVKGTHQIREFQRKDGSAGTREEIILREIEVISRKGETRAGEVFLKSPGGEVMKLPRQEASTKAKAEGWLVGPSIEGPWWVWGPEGWVAPQSKQPNPEESKYAKAIAFLHETCPTGGFQVRHLDPFSGDRKSSFELLSKLENSGLAIRGKAGWYQLAQLSEDRITILALNLGD